VTTADLLRLLIQAGFPGSWRLCRPHLDGDAGLGAVHLNDTSELDVRRLIDDVLIDDEHTYVGAATGVNPCVSYADVLSAAYRCPH
jgi:hypothetical protein